jgi:hypothetical protein
MSNSPFDREVINFLERPLSSDINMAESYLDQTLRELVDRLMLPRASNVDANSASVPPSGFIGAGFFPAPASVLGMTVVLKPGLGFLVDTSTQTAAVGSVVGLNDLARYKPALLTAEQSITVPAAPAGPNSRIDIIEVKLNSRTLTDSTSRDVFDVGSQAFVASSVNKTLSWKADGSVSVVASPTNSTGAIGYKTGVPGVVPVAPATTAGYIKIGEVLVGSAVVTLDADVIKDLRVILSPYGLTTVSAEAAVVATGGSAAPTLVTLDAPPGYKAIVVCSATTAGAEATLYVIGGGAFASLGGAVHPLPVIYIPPAVAVFYVVNAVFSTGVVDATIQGLMANAARANPVTKVAIGQPYAAVQFNAKHMNAGVVDNGLGATFNFSINLNLKR